MDLENAQTRSTRARVNSLTFSGFQFDLPPHEADSTLCPAHPLHQATDRVVCVVSCCRS